MSSYNGQQGVFEVGAVGGGRVATQQDIVPAKQTGPQYEGQPTN